MPGLPVCPASSTTTRSALGQARASCQAVVEAFVAAGGKYSMNGTFGGPSKVCPPGGTFPN